jgi:5'-nucleotidase
LRILLSNDDGYLAPGIGMLAAGLASVGEVIVVAPDRDRSGASNSLTLDYPIHLQRAENGFYYVDGTPTDCVHLALTGLLDSEPDIVISGINSGANLGDDVLYSGTVAAAMEGRFLGLPAMAVSVAGEQITFYDTAVRVVTLLLDGVAQSRIPANTILNINVPDLPWENLQGLAVTRLGHRHRAEPVVCDKDPRGRPIYWVGPSGPEQDGGPGTDFFAIRQGCVSITPMQVDLTRYAALNGMREWIGGLMVK